MGEVIAAALVLLLGILVLWWARACRRGTFARQVALGYRSSLTLRDRDAWTAVHRALAPCLFTAGTGTALGGSVGLVLAAVGAGGVVPPLLGGALAWGLLWILVGFIPAAAAARSYRHQRQARR